MSVPGIYKKLHSIMSEANYIQKDKKNPHFGYSYASEAAIKEKLHELFVKHKVLFSASAVNQQITEIGRNDKGKGRFRTTLDLTYRFFDIEDGSCIEGSMAGAGVDDEDKGTYKAITGALKYCLTSQFIIPTGDDPESDSGNGKTNPEPERTNKRRESTTVGAPPPTQTSPQQHTNGVPLSVRECLDRIDESLLSDSKEVDFVQQFRERAKKYREVRISEKQLNWMRQIVKKCTEGSLEDAHAGNYGGYDSPPPTDDDIPF